MGEMIERVAQAMWFDFVDQQGYPNGQPSWDEMSTWEALPNRCEEFRSMARAAIEAMCPPTDAMCAIGYDAVSDLSGYFVTGSDKIAAAWKVMIAEALNEPSR